MTTTTDLTARVEGNVPARPSGMNALLESMAPQFARALPAHIPAERFTRLALTALNSNPALKRCTPESFLGALMTCAQLGLEPNTPTGEAYLIPYGQVCTFVPGYQGLVKLAWQSGAISEIYAEVVREKDVFSFRKGLHRDLIHEPFLGDDGGKIIGCYAVVKMTDGGMAFDYWPLEEIKRHQAAHSKKRSGGPADTASWMERKTVLRQVLKLVPKSTNVGLALAHDGGVRTDLSFQALDLIEADPVGDVTDAEVIEDVTLS